MRHAHASGVTVSWLLNRLCWLSAACIVVLLILNLSGLSPWSATVLDNVGWTSTHTLAAVLAWLGVLDARQRALAAPLLLARRWFALGLTSYAIGQWLYNAQQVLGWSAQLAPADVFWLACGPFVGVGFWHCLRSTGRPMRALSLDVIAVTAAAIALILALYVAQQDAPGTLQWVVVAAYPISLLGAAVMGLIAVPAMSARWHFSWILLLVGLLGRATCWMYWNALSTQGEPPAGSLLNLGFTVFGWMIGVGAACWRMEKSDSVPWHRNAGRILFSLPLIVVATAVYSVAQLWSGQASQSVQVVMLLCAGVVVVAAVLRQSVMLADRLHAQQALARSEAELRAIFDNSPIGIGLFDERGYMVRTNRAVQEMTGYSQDDYLHYTVMDVTHPEDRPASAKAYQLLAQGKPRAQLEKRYLCKDGHYLWGRLTVSKLSIPGEPQLRFIGLLEDVSERHVAEEALQAAQQEKLRLREEFTQHLLDAQEQERQRVANELHDSVGQTLSLIKNRTYLAIESLGSPEERRMQLEGMLELSGEAINEVRRIVHNLRPLHIEELGLTNALSSLIQRVGESSALELQVQIENIDDAVAPGQVTHVYRLMQEALNNVIKHAQATQVKVEVIRDLHAVIIMVHDNGRGFSADAQTLHRGLGLTSMSERAQMLHGRFEVRSAPEAGTTLRVELPVASQEPAASALPEQVEPQY